MMSPERTSWPAMLTPVTCISETMIGCDQVAPPSVDRMTATLNDARWLLPLPPLLRIRSKPSIRTPAAGPAVGTTIWLAIVWFFSPGSKIGLPSLQVTPPSVVFENIAGPRKAGETLKAPGFAFGLGEPSRSQTAQARFGAVGSAVTVSLSLSTVVDASRRPVPGV